MIQLVRALAALPGPEHFTVFVQEHGRRLIGLPAGPRLDLQVVRTLSPGLRLAWEQTAFPGLVRRSGAGLLHSLHYTLPLHHPCRSVVTLHDLTYFLFPHLHTLPKRYFFRLFILLSARRADALLADSESTRQDAIRLAGADPARIHTALLGVTPEFRPIANRAHLEAVRRKYRLPERYVLFVGLQEPRKNLPALLGAFGSIAGRIPGHTLVIAGRQGWQMNQLNRQLGRLRLGERVHFTGYVDQDDLPGVYNLADVFVYPSLYEGFGLPVLEGMACGTPVITTNVSSMPEITGEAGVLVPPGDERALAEALLGLLNDPARREALARQGVQRAAGFTWQRTAQQTLAVYRAVLQTDQGARRSLV
jgi:glycosyltransferase involved in cell wall biosynthesis